MLQTKVVEKIKTHVLCAITFFFENLAVCKIMWENTVQPDSRTGRRCQYNMAHKRWITKSTDASSNMQYFSFSMTTMVTTRLVRFLSCSSTLQASIHLIIHLNDRVNSRTSWSLAPCPPSVRILLCARVHAYLNSSISQNSATSDSSGLKDTKFSTRGRDKVVLIQWNLPIMEHPETGFFFVAGRFHLMEKPEVKLKILGTVKVFAKTGFRSVQVPFQTGLTVLSSHVSRGVRGGFFP
jgi:hypothetical protein